MKPVSHSQLLILAAAALWLTSTSAQQSKQPVSPSAQASSPDKAGKTKPQDKAASSRPVSNLSKKDEQVKQGVLNNLK